MQEQEPWFYREKLELPSLQKPSGTDSWLKIGSLLAALSWAEDKSEPLRLLAELLQRPSWSESEVIERLREPSETLKLWSGTPGTISEGEVAGSSLGQAESCEGRNSTARRSEMVPDKGGEANGMPRRDDGENEGSISGGLEGNPAKLKLCFRRGGRVVLVGREGCRGQRWSSSSSSLCTKWQRIPYGQKPIEWNVRHGSVLYFGCRLMPRSSSSPWANWHLLPYLHVPLSVKVRHSSVL